VSTAARNPADIAKRRRTYKPPHLNRLFTMRRNVGFTVARN